MAHLIRTSLIPERIAARAAAAPDAVAVVEPRGNLTYAELIHRADQIARHLLASGVTPTDLVGVCLDRGSSLVAALLGVLRAGCGYLPLDPEYPPDRLGFMLRDSGATAVIGTSEHLARVPPGAAKLIDMADGPTSAGASEVELPGVSARDLAYVIYTSGSTGVPKGVAVEHGQVARLFDAVQQRVPVSETDVWSWFHSVAFDFSVWEIWGALASGGRLVVVSGADARDPAAFLSVVRRSGTTILSQTPSAFHGLLAILDREHQDWSVRTVVLGGEAVSVAALASLFQGPPGGRPRLYNLYGITETTVHATVKELTSHDLHAGVRSPIGTPLEDLRLAVMDSARRRVPPGEQGELWVGGAGVARGYIGRPELTADRFVTGLLPEYGHMRWYRSGDLARELPSGEFEYIGRIDRQVKLRGFRVELGEVEAALVGHPEVAAAAVELRGERLIAYLVAARQAVPNLDEIREWLASRLPGYMIPSSFISLDALPLTANGKIDRAALGREPGVPLPRRAAAHDPQTAAESALQAIWSRVLGTTTIGRDDSFFAIGGDSMLALHVVAECKDAGIGLTVRDLFAHPTLACLARVVGALPAGAGGEEAGREEAGREEAGREQAAAAPDADVLIPASQMQRGMLFEAARNPEAYHVVSAIRISSSRDFSEGDVRAALLRLTVDNAALRMSFDLLHHRRPMQIVHGAPELCLDYLNVSGLSPREQEQRISDVFAHEHARHFTEHDFLLWRLACVQVSPRSAEVMLAHHHAILDGWSVARFFDQFSAALSGQPYQAAPVSINQAAARLEDAAIASAGDAAFWRSQAQAWRPLPLSPRARQANGFVSARAHVDAPLREAIRDTAARWQCSPKHVYLAAHLRAIADFAGWDDYAATGVVVNGRPELPQAHNALGMFLNVVPLVVTGLGSNYADLARAAAEAETRLQPHRWFPQATMVAEFGIPPLNVCFNYTDFSSTAMRGFLSSVTETSPNGMPLTVSVVDDGLVAEVATQYLSADQCARLVRCHEKNLRDAIRG
jgi:amino acid adenylation domain-containing protein